MSTNDSDFYVKSHSVGLVQGTTLFSCVENEGMESLGDNTHNFRVEELHNVDSCHSDDPTMEESG